MLLFLLYLSLLLMPLSYCKTIDSFREFLTLLRLFSFFTEIHNSEKLIVFLIMEMRLLLADMYE